MNQPTPPPLNPYTTPQAQPVEQGVHHQTPVPPPLNQQKSLGLATTSLVLGILSIMLTGIFTAIPGVIYGHMARKQLQREPGVYDNASMALIGLIMSYIIIGITVLIAVVLIGMLIFIG